MLERFGRRPVDLLDDLGWIDGDVWVAHGIHLDDAEVASARVRRGRAWRTARRATRGSAPGCAGWPTSRRPGSPVGLGVDGAASNEVGGLQPELRQALYTARQRAGARRRRSCRRMRSASRPRAARGAWAATTSAGSKPGYRADLVVWPGDDLGGRPRPARGPGPRPRSPGPPRLVEGEPVVRDGELARGGRGAPSGATWPNAPAGSGPEPARVPLQNRVTPLGDLVADPGRGLVYGNRGCLHDERAGSGGATTVERWIACRLRFRGWHREPLLQPGRFTELFFLDEATAFAAGHRPCALCRREDYVRFGEIWRELHPGPGRRRRDRRAAP